MLFPADIPQLWNKNKQLLSCFISVAYGKQDNKTPGEPGNSLINSFWETFPETLWKRTFLYTGGESSNKQQQ